MLNVHCSSSPGASGAMPANPLLSMCHRFRTGTESMSLPTLDLRYPIGEFSPPDPLEREQVNVWIDDIAALPADLRRTVSALTDHRLDTPVSPARLDGPAGRAPPARQPHEQPDPLQVGADRGPADSSRPTTKRAGRCCPTAGSPSLVRSTCSTPCTVAGCSLLRGLSWDATAARVRAPRVGFGHTGGHGRLLRLARPASPDTHRAAARP